MTSLVIVCTCPCLCELMFYEFRVIATQYCHIQRMQTDFRSRKVPAQAREDHQLVAGCRSHVELPVYCDCSL